MTAPGPAGPARRLRLLIALLVLAIGGSAAYGLLKARARAHKDSAYCAGSCHVQPKHGGKWQARGHEDVTCQECHATTEAVSFELYWKGIVGSKELPKHGRAAPATCEHCHDRNPATWRLVADTDGHRTHRGVKDVDCNSCHAAEVHKDAHLDEKTCIDKCHKAQRLHKRTADAETCYSCHAFAVSEKLAQPPTAVFCEKCHGDEAKMKANGPAHGPGSAPFRVMDRTVLHGRLDCKLCHDPHNRKIEIPAGQPSCARCHQMATFQGGPDAKAGPEGHKNCEGCHKPHAPRKQALAACADCHEKNAKGIAMGVLAAGAAPGKPTALQHESCASCHLPHTWKAERSGCATCHEDKAKSIQTAGPAQHGECLSCHSVHAAQPTGMVCVTCHKDKSNHVFAAPGKHKDCVSCHNPHAANKNAAREACAKCHVNEVGSMARGPQGHLQGSCFGCHKQPHNNPMPPPNLCSTCHEGNAKQAAASTVQKHKACASCHEGHKFSIAPAEIAGACNKCHNQVVSAGGPHGGECKQCHTLHGSPQIARQKCLGCHDKVQASFKAPNPQHDKCASCHQPHRPAAAAPAKCGTCHQPQVQVAASWPAKSAHAEACNKCHQPHDVRDQKTCASCHQKEAESALAAAGKHKCAQCHAPHKAPPGTGAAWWSRCSQCHDDKVMSCATKGQTHQKCDNCHKPHGFGKPGCTGSCHNDMASKGVHAVKEHAAKCSACHDPHTKSEPTRQQCLSCHTKQRDHEPKAERCQACHPFK